MKARPMLKFLRALPRRFAADRKGAIAILFGMLAVPMILGVGVFVDYSRALIARERLNNAIDAAALAIGASAGEDLSDEEIEALAQSYFDANYPPSERGWMAPLEVEVDGDVVRISSSGRVDTTLMRLAQIDHLDIAANTEVTRQQNKIELVMALDNTGSMAGSKLTSLKDAATGLVNILFGDEDDSEFVKVGLVPFAAAVNVGTANVDTGWIDLGVGGRSSIHFEDFDMTGTEGVLKSNIDLFALLRNARSEWGWAGCVRARPGALALDDTEPNAGNPDTLFVPYLAPDEPDEDFDDDYNNSYLDDRFGDSDGGGDGGGGKGKKKKGGGGGGGEAICSGSDTAANRQRCVNKYYHIVRDSDGQGPNVNCAARPILPLTNVKDDVTDEIDDMVASGNTVIPEGLAWAWRVISPGAPFTEGVDYDDGKTVKAIILLTDGANVSGGPNGTHNGSTYNAFGYAASGHLGATNGSQGNAKLNEYTATVCENVKEAGIRLYTITFGSVGSATQTLMQNCATETSMYYHSPSTSDLDSVFADIAKGLNQLRISK
jgi:Flp pilus assembly protein TadG